MLGRIFARCLDLRRNGWERDGRGKGDERERDGRGMEEGGVADALSVVASLRRLEGNGKDKDKRDGEGRA